MRRDPWPACDACGDPAQYSAGGGAAPEFFACVDCLDTVPDDERDSWSEIVAPAEDVDAEAAVVTTFRERCGLCCICGEEPIAFGMDPPGRCVRCARLSRECA